MVVLGGVAVSYESSTPIPKPKPREAPLPVGYEPPEGFGSRLGGFGVRAAPPGSALTGAALTVG